MGELEGTLELKTVDAFEPEVTELVRFALGLYRQSQQQCLCS